MSNEKLDQPDTTPEHTNSLPTKLLQEIDSARKVASQVIQGFWHQLEANSASSQGQAATVEFSSPFKDKAAESAGQRPAESSNDLKAEQPERRYDNSDIMQAFEASAKTGLPLVVAIENSSCPHCQEMEKNVWPKTEGSADKQGTFQGKAIFLHLDYIQSKSLDGEAGQIAEDLRKGVESVPTIRMYSVAADGKISLKGQTVGELSQGELEEFLKPAGSS